MGFGEKATPAPCGRVEHPASPLAPGHSSNQRNEQTRHFLPGQGIFLALSRAPQTHQEQRLPGSHEDSSEKGGLLSWWVRVLRGCEPRDQLGEKAKLYLEAL